MAKLIIVTELGMFNQHATTATTLLSIRYILPCIKLAFVMAHVTYFSTITCLRPCYMLSSSMSEMSIKITPPAELTHMHGTLSFLQTANWNGIATINVCVK